MELRQLETFVKLVEAKTFTRAADELSLTQPAVTRQIGALERELKTRLLDRLGRRVAPTAAGEALYRYAVDIVRLAEEAKKAVGDVAAGVSGHLSVGASGTVSTYILPAVIRRFTERFADVELSVHTGPSAQIVALVADNSVDLGVVMNFAGRPGIAAVTVAMYESVLVAHPDERFTAADHAGGLSAQRLADERFILMQRGTNLRTYVDELLGNAGVQPHVVMELDNVEAIKKMVQAGLGVSMLPWLAVEEDISAGRLVAIAVAGVGPTERPISAIYREDKYLSAALKEFVAVLRNEIG